MDGQRERAHEIAMNRPCDGMNAGERTGAGPWERERIHGWGETIDLGDVERMERKRPPCVRERMDGEITNRPERELNVQMERER